MSDVPAVTDATFDAEVLKSALPVMVDFSATWCGPCRRLAPVVEELAREHAGKIKVVKLDIDENAQAAAQYGITGVPTLLFFMGGAVVGRLMGLQPKPRIVDQIAKVVGG
jgi:thioredoxin 1